MDFDVNCSYVLWLWQTGRVMQLVVVNSLFNIHNHNNKDFY